MKNIFSIAAISGFMCVALGAFGAHGLKALITEDMLHAWEKGVQYQFYHTIALLFMGVLLQSHQNKNLTRAAQFFLAGIILFSGSLYALALTSISGNTWHWLGPITPLGGICFLTGWVFLFLFSINKK